MKVKHVDEKIHEENADSDSGQQKIELSNLVLL